LLATVSNLLPLLKCYGRLPWLNLGGGYLFHAMTNLKPLSELIQRLKAQAVDQVYLEPGKAVVGNAGYLLTTVVDRFESDGKTVLVLDTSVNHHPKVFEYQIKPLLLEEDAAGGRQAILAGSTCLAGDLFGEYRFNRLPVVGDRLVFADVGAYSLIKANRFNGYALPDIYCLSGQRLDLIKQDGYGDYQRQWG
jgi:carboxynorspermidine decarboxylase